MKKKLEITCPCGFPGTDHEHNKKGETMKHTPGPWNIVGGNENERTDIVKIGPGYVSHIAHLHDQWLCDEHGGTAFANARLIIAAPKLLEALEWCIGQMEFDGFIPEWPEVDAAWGKARAILAKAQEG